MAKIDINGSFEQGWDDVPPTGNSGWLVNQQPKKWKLSILPPGAALYDSSDKATGEAECVHKLIGTLPPNEHPGQPNALILDGAATYKIFNSGAAYGAELRQTVTGLEPLSDALLAVPVLIDRPKSVNDPWHTEVMVAAGGVGKWHNGQEQTQKKWVTHRVECLANAAGELDIVIRVKSKWPLEAAFFLDGITLDGTLANTNPPDPPDPPDPPPADDLEERVTAVENENGNQQEEINALSMTVFNLQKRVEDLENTNPNPPPVLEYPYLAVDLSAHNTLTGAEWDKLKAGGVKLAIIRSSNGMGSTSTNNGVDKLLFSHLSRARERGILTAVYHFYNERDGTEQIDLWASILKGVEDSGYNIHSLWLDFEESSPESETAIRDGCLYAMAKVGNIAPLGIYTRATWWNPRVKKESAWPKQFRIWTAAWVSRDPVNTAPKPVNTYAVPHHWKTNNVWQFTSQGGPMFGLSRGLDVNWALSAAIDTPPTPPTAQTVNILQYLRGVHRQQFDKEYIVNGRSGTQTTMIEHLGPYEWLYVKGTNGEYEHFWVQFWNGQDWIFRADDTSESADRMYAHYMSNGGALGAPWVPVVMEVNKVYQTSKFVQHYAKSNCAKLNGGNVTDSIKLTSPPYSKTYQGGKVEKVITLQWASGEQYDFAERGGNIGFRKPNEDFWFMGWLEGRQPLTYKKYACLGW